MLSWLKSLWSTPKSNLPDSGWMLEIIYKSGVILIAPATGIILLLLWGNIWVAGVGFILAFLLCLETYKVEAPKRGVVLCLGERTGRTLDEGTHFIWPFGIDKVEDDEFKIDIREGPVKISATCLDGPEVTVESTVLYRADEHMLATQFYEAEAPVIIRGLEETVQNTVGDVAGQHNSKDLYKKRPALKRLIDSILRLETPPHSDPEFLTSLGLKIGGDSHTLIRDSDRKRLKLLDFYSVYHQQVDERLNRTGKGSHSRIEKALGIDIGQLTLKKVSFSVAYTNSLEQKRIAQEKKVAAEERAKFVSTMTAKLTDLEVNPDRAAAITLLLQEMTGVQIVETGGTSPLPIININGGRP